jgi:hypothetical protein
MLLETKLGSVEKAQSVAWVSSIQSDLGDLVVSTNILFHSCPFV